MKLSEIQRQISEEQSALLLRPRKEEHIKGQPIQYDTKPLFTGNKRGWVMLDITTNNALQSCYNALKEDKSKAKWDCIPVMKLVDFAWQHIS